MAVFMVLGAVSRASLFGFSIWIFDQTINCHTFHTDIVKKKKRKINLFAHVEFIQDLIYIKNRL